jgi:hypothetical protein
MSSWYKVTVKYEETTPRGSGRSLQEIFEELFIGTGAPRDVALFGDRSDDFNYYFYYFSPGAHRIAAELIERYRGVTCQMPSGERLALLAGHASAREDLLKH